MQGCVNVYVVQRYVVAFKDIQVEAVPGCDFLHRKSSSLRTPFKDVFNKINSQARYITK